MTTSTTPKVRRCPANGPGWTAGTAPRSNGSATSTTLYGLDAATDSLVRAVSANAGTYTNTSLLGNIFAPLGAGITFMSGDRVGFDISGSTNLGFFTINDRFFSIDLASGLATSIGALSVGGITGITAAAAVPEPATWAMMLIGFGAIGYSMRKRQGRKPAFAV